MDPFGGIQHTDSEAEAVEAAVDSGVSSDGEDSTERPSSSSGSEPEYVPSASERDTEGGGDTVREPLGGGDHEPPEVVSEHVVETRQIPDSITVAASVGVDLVPELRVETSESLTPVLPSTTVMSTLPTVPLPIPMVSEYVAPPTEIVRSHVGVSSVEIRPAASHRDQTPSMDTWDRLMMSMLQTPPSSTFGVPTYASPAGSGQLPAFQPSVGRPPLPTYASPRPTVPMAVSTAVTPQSIYRPPPVGTSDAATVGTIRPAGPSLLGASSEARMSDLLRAELPSDPGSASGVRVTPPVFPGTLEVYTGVIEDVPIPVVRRPEELQRFISLYPADQAVVVPHGVLGQWADWLYTMRQMLNYACVQDSGFLTRFERFQESLVARNSRPAPIGGSRSMSRSQRSTSRSHRSAASVVGTRRQREETEGSGDSESVAQRPRTSQQDPPPPPPPVI